jgi:uncharacterized metal-binding protein YceD (DUF177 family)
MNAVEFSRPVRVETLSAAPRRLSVEADADERAALAQRFGLIAIDRLVAELDLTRAGELVTAAGTLKAEVTQSCVASGAPVPSTIDEAFRILFSPESENGPGSEEIELKEEDCDVVFYADEAIDVGEAAAETLSLSLDPWPRAPGAEELLRQAGVKGEDEVRPDSPLAAALKAKLKK